MMAFSIEETIGISWEQNGDVNSGNYYIQEQTRWAVVILHNSADRKCGDKI